MPSLLLLSLLTGCSDRVELEPLSVLTAQTQGVYLSATGRRGVAAMATQRVCGFSPRSRSTYDWLVMEEQTVLLDGNDDQRLLLRHDDGSAELVATDVYGVTGSTMLETPLRSGVLIPGGWVGVAASEGGCVLHWSTPSPNTTIQVAPALCLGESNLRVSGPVVGVSVDGLAWSVRSAKFTYLGDSADLVQPADRGTRFYLASRTSSSVRALDWNGESIWSTDVGDVVLDVRDAGEFVAVLTPQALVLLSSEEGRKVVREWIPGADSLAVSSNGGVIGVVDAEQIAFFGVGKPGEPAPEFAPSDRAPIGTSADTGWTSQGYDTSEYF